MMSVHWIRGLAVSLLAGAPVWGVGAASPGPQSYLGMCDASAAVALDDARFAVANDEDNVIRVYSSEKPGLPVASIPLSDFLQVDRKKPETDFEGASWLGDRIFWISSHGRNRDGRYRESRHRFFAMQWVTNASPPQLLPVGRPYRYLLSDLVREPSLAVFRLGAASHRAPKARDALNIEGLCATSEGGLLIGFRNPIPAGKALVVPLLNPGDLIQGFPARFGEASPLDLDGLGIRDMTRLGNSYMIVAGAYDASDGSRLYRWDGPGREPRRIETVDLRGLNPEAAVVYPSMGGRVQLLSDDGTCLIGGVPCKMLKDPSQRRFRGLWIDLPASF